MDLIQIVSLNVWGLQNARKIFTFCKYLNADVFLLQEMHCTPDDSQLWRSEWGSSMFNAYGTNRSCGCSILLSKHTKINPYGTYCDPQNGRFIIMDAGVNDSRFTLVNVYGPNRDDPGFFDEVFKLTELFPNCEMLLGGDFNLVMDAAVDRTPPLAYNTCAANKLAQYAESFDLVDVWRVLNPTTTTYSWTRYAPTFTGSRLDFYLCNRSLVNKVTDIQYSPCLYTDHSSIAVTLDFSEQPRGPGYWKFNNLLLQDKRYEQMIKTCLQDLEVKYAGCDGATLWEIAKHDINNITIQYSKEKSLNKRKRYNDLMSAFTVAQNVTHENPTKHNIEALHMHKLAVAELIAERTNAAMFRSKAHWHKAGEKNSKYFFSLEKSNYNRKVMKRIQLEDGRYTTNPNEILVEQHRFFKKLYTADSEVHFTLQNPTNVRVTEDDRKMLEEDISITEIRNAVLKLKKDKSPGCDGFTAEFYQYFWNEIESMYVSAIHCAVEQKRLHLSAGRGVVSLIPKKNRPPFQIKNWRPLTMLTMDYKIIATVLANRLKKVLPYIISHDQTGFMSGRQITSTIRRTMDAIDLTGSLELPGYLICADFVKCFDLITYEGIRGALNYFGIGPKFIGYMDLLLNDFKSCVTNNGHLSDWFEVSRSCRQGCPLAPYLMLICGEMMAITMKHHPKTIPLEICGINHIVSQFVDDAQFFTATNPDGLRAIEESLQCMKRNVGFKINAEKNTAVLAWQCRISREV